MTSSVEPEIQEDAGATPRANPSWASTLGRRFTVVATVLLGLLVFILALELLKKGAGGVAVILRSVSAHGFLNLWGFGWLMAYAAMSGSPIAATALTLLVLPTLYAWIERRRQPNIDREEDNS